MKEYIYSLSLMSGAGLVAVICSLVSMLVILLRFRMKKTIVSVFAFLISFNLYWIPASGDQAGSWASLFIVFWTICGMSVSILIVVLYPRILKILK